MAGSGGAGAAPREHRLQPGDTLPGLALRYGVTMEQIQRANRLYSSDTIFLKPTLLIPTPANPEVSQVNQVNQDNQDNREYRDNNRDIPEEKLPEPSRHDLSASDFLRRLDAEIGRSKEAAALQIRSQEGSTVPSPAGHSPLSPRGGQLGPRALSRSKRAAALRDTEDDIFAL